MKSAQKGQHSTSEKLRIFGQRVTDRPGFVENAPLVLSFGSASAQTTSMDNMPSPSHSSAVEPTGASAEPVLALHRRGDLVAEYPRVRGLLADLPPGELSKAGRALSKIKARDVLASHPGTPTITVGVTGNAVLSGLSAAVTAQCARHGLFASVDECDFDSWIRDLGDGETPFSVSPPDLALVVLDPAVVFGSVPPVWSPDNVQSVLDQRIDLLASLVTDFSRRNPATTLVLNTIPLPRLAAAQLTDHRSRARLGAIWRSANVRILELAELAGVVVVDTETLYFDGIAVTEPRLSVYAKAHLSPELLNRYAREVGHIARQRVGRSKKILAVDLDGTLWGGVLGDDGVEGIEVADTYRVESFRSLQGVVKQLSAQGVLVAAES